MNGNGNSILKWLATTLGGVVLGLLIATVASAWQAQAIVEIAQENAVLESRVDNLEQGIDRITTLIQGISDKIDRLHGREP